ncbi:hypothetical protein PpBr36_08762 [Pyricularia pennisetigena]|uniref:hypothetical protein n=1 Tax=Pyricularia pennisetigena TaxID=1578925 RepID=UPI001150B9B9|nr:hypothetical protein PpBr36_08762 [Pyricularia pennisetigena]TLS23902.1 hypothetical protein PpBr36_08762 [Pyricularia pennisetigena]
MASVLTIAWRLVLMILLGAFCAGQEAPGPSAICRWPDGSDHKEGVVCAGRENGRSCCAQGQERMSCADPGLLRENCPAINLCHDEAPGSPGLLRQCPLSGVYGFCLRPDAWEGDCADARLILSPGHVDDGRNRNDSGIFNAGEVDVSQTDATAQEVPAAINSSSSSSSSSHVSTIAVGVSLGVLLLAAATAAVFFLRRWKAVLLELDAARAGMETMSPPETQDRRPNLKQVPSVAEVALPVDRSELPQIVSVAGPEIHEADAGQIFEVHESHHSRTALMVAERIESAHIDLIVYLKL